MAFRPVVLLGMMSVMLFTGCGRSRDDLYKEGRQLQGEGNYRGAIVLYKNVLEKDPSDVEARYSLAESYLAADRFDFAEKEFRKVALQDLTKMEVHLRLAELYTRTRRAQQAASELETFAKSSQPTSEYWDLLGRTRALNHDLPGAEAAFREALRLEPSRVSARMHLADTVARRGKTKEAREMLRTLLRSHPKEMAANRLLARLETAEGEIDAAISLYSRMGEIDPGNAEADYSRGLLLLEKGDTAQARQIAEKMLSGNPAPPEGLQLRGLVRFTEEKYEDAAIDLTKALEGRSDLTALYFLGLSHLKRGQYETALNHFQRFLDFRPEAVQPRLMVAAVLLKQKRTDDAVRELEKILQNDAKNAPAHTLLGNALLARGDDEGAMIAFDRALALDPGMAEAHLRKGIFRFSRGAVEAGEADLARAVTASPEAIDSRLLLALHYLQQRNYPDAVKLLEKGLTGGAEDALLYNYLGVAYFGRKEEKRAVEALQKAKEHDPDYPGSYYNLAAWRLSRGDLKRAEEEYEAILARKPTELRALLLAGEVTERAGDKDRSLAYYRRAEETGAPEGIASLAAFYLREGRQTEGLQALQEGLRRHPGQPGLLALKGKYHLSAQEWNAAADAFESLEKTSPGAGLDGMVEACSASGDWSRAERAIQEVLRKEPQRVPGHLAYVKLLERRGRRGAALAHLESLGNHRRTHSPLALAYAGLLERQGETKQAIAAYEQILAASGESPQVLFSLGALHDSQGDREKALRLYRRTLEKDPEFTPALNNLAFLYADRPTDRPRALDLARRAYRLEPENPWILDTLGYVLVRTGQAGEGVPLLEKAVSRLSGSPTIHYHLALAYRALNREKEAAEVLRKALAMGSFPEAKKADQLLSGLSETGKEKRK